MVSKKDRQLETHIRASALTMACLDAGLRAPIRFKAVNQKEPTELMWSHKDGRLSVYVNPGGGFSIEDIPYHEVPDDDLETVREVIEVLSKHSFLWDPNVERVTDEDTDDETEELDEDGFPTV